jgi:hypothetical protein
MLLFFLIPSKRKKKKKNLQEVIQSVEITSNEVDVTSLNSPLLFYANKSKKKKKSTFLNEI